MSGLQLYENLVLASGSKSRLNLLEVIGVRPGAVIPPEIDESVLASEPPKAYCERIALNKANKVFSLYPNCFVLSADTVACCGYRVLPKAENLDQARYCIDLLSGRRHRVYTAVSLFSPCGKFHVKTVMSVVRFKQLSHQEKEFYLQSGQWKGKAGGCNIQGFAESFIAFISGSYSAISGLPLHETYCLLIQYFDILKRI